MMRFPRDHGAEQLRGLDIFIAEDEAIIAMELEAVVQDHGANVVGPAFLLAPALELAATARISAAILDLRLGRYSIAPVAQLLRDRQIPFVFYSGQPPTDPIRAQWRDYTLVAKPALPRILIDALAREIAGAARS